MSTLSHSVASAWKNNSRKKKFFFPSNNNFFCLNRTPQIYSIKMSKIYRCFQCCLSSSSRVESNRNEDGAKLYGVSNISVIFFFCTFIKSLKIEKSLNFMRFPRHHLFPLEDCCYIIMTENIIKRFFMCVCVCGNLLAFSFQS